MGVLLRRAARTGGFICKAPLLVLMLMVLVNWCRGSNYGIWVGPWMAWKSTGHMRGGIIGGVRSGSSGQVNSTRQPIYPKVLPFDPLRQRSGGAKPPLTRTRSYTLEMKDSPEFSRISWHSGKLTREADRVSDEQKQLSRGVERQSSSCSSNALCWWRGSCARTRKGP